MRTIPIIKLQRTLIVSIQIELSDRLVVELKENIAHEIRRQDVAGLVIDVSGVDIFDSYIARSVRDITHIAGLMGVRTVLSGLDAGMAITLVEMGMLMQGVESALNLELALAFLADNERREAHELELDVEAATKSDAELLGLDENPARDPFDS